MTDTEPEVERRRVEIYRRLSAQEKWRQLGEMFDMAKQLAAAGALYRNSHATDAELHSEWLARTVGHLPGK
jgi:hypothetical protein